MKATKAAAKTAGKPTVERRAPSPVNLFLMSLAKSLILLKMSSADVACAEKGRFRLNWFLNLVFRSLELSGHTVIGNSPRCK